MFKINNIKLLNKEKKVVQNVPFNKDINFVYAPNSKGKTLLVNNIDYVLGSSSINYENNMDMKGIYYVACDCTNCVIIRGVKDKRCCYFKDKTNDSAFHELSLEQYKMSILNKLLEGNSDDLTIINKTYGEDLSFRPFLIFNFLDQKNHGVLKNIFTKLFETTYYIYSKPIFKYLFNKDNMVKIYKNVIAINKLKEQREEINVNQDLFSYYLSQLKKNLSLLGIEYTNNYEQLMIDVTEKKNNVLVSAEKNTSINKDYYYLLDLNVELTCQIKKLEQEERQSALTQKDIDKRNKVLFALDEIVEDNKQLGNLVSPLKELISKNSLYSKFLRAQDYRKAINSLKKKREKVVEDIQKYVANQQEISYSEQIEIVNSTINILNKINSIRIMEVTSIDQTIKKLSEENRFLENNYDVASEQEISDVATSLYKSLLGKHADFVDQDFSMNGFSLFFNYRQMAINGSFLEKGVRVNYDVGSHARQTIIQLCCYLSFLHFLNKHHFSLPIMNTVVLDCVSQPCDEKTKNCIKHLLDYYIKNINPNYSFIVTSDNKPSCEPDYYDMSDGFNPFIKLV